MLFPILMHTNLLQNICLVGTNHISDQSLQDIKQQFLSFQPDIIAIELDKQRFAALQSPQQETKIGLSTIRAFGVRGTFFLLIARYAQQKLGKVVGMKPGSEMLFASQLAKNNHLRLALIDRSIQHTIKRLFKQLTWKEKFRFLGDFLFAPFKKKQRVTFSITDVPNQDMLSSLLLQIRARYPTLYRVLVHERDMYMARELILLAKSQPDKKILAVVGAGHVAGMTALLPSYLQRIDVV